MFSFRDILQYIFSLAILSIAFLLPAFQRTTGFGIGILIVAWLADGNLVAKFKNILHQSTPLLFISVYLVYLLGMLNTTNVWEGVNNLILKVSFLIFPMIFFAPGHLLLPKLRTILRFFILGCILASGILLTVAAYTYFTSGKQNFFYTYLTAPLSIHPAIFSMYIIFCSFCLLTPFLEKSSNHLFGHRVISWLFILFFLVMIFLLSARQEMIAVVLFLPGLLLFYFFRKKKWFIGIGITAVLVGVLLLILFLIPETKMRLTKMQSQMEEPYTNDAPNSVTMRKVIWEAAGEIVREHPMVGVGTGDVNDALKSKYKAKNLIWPLNDNLNAHNQYLQTAMAVGIPGLLFFIASLIAGLRIAFIKKYYLYAMFTLLFIFCIITECMLEEEAGLVFFTFFNSLLAVEATRRVN